MAVLVTNERQFEQDCDRVGAMLQSQGITGLVNPHKLWVLEPPRRQPEPNRKQLT